MSTPVSSGALNFSASSAAANSDIGRYAGNGPLNLSFSDLLRGQVQSGFSNHASELPSLANANPSRTPSPPEPPRETSRAPSPNSIPSRPSQEPTREPVRASGRDNLPEAGQKRLSQTQGTAPPQHAETGESIEESIEISESAGTGKSAETREKEKTAGDNTTTERHLQPQLTEGAISSDLAATADLLTIPDLSVTTDLPATIAALLSGLAGEIAENIPEDGLAPEASARGAAPHGMGLPRHPEMPGNLSARATVFVQADMGAENDNAECGSNGDQGTNPLATPASRPPRQAASAGGTAALTGTGNEPSARVNAAAAFGTMVNAANALSAAPHEGSGARTVPAGITANAGEISLLNPPRFSTQAGAALPQFTIPAGAGQKNWAEEVGNRVMWMLGRAQSRAELILTPPLLGKVEVSIHLNGDQSTAQFLASSQSAREALEQAMPRLRELLAQAGINLGEASVNTSAEGQTQGGENTHRAGAHAGELHDIPDDGGDASGIPPQNWSRLDTGLINTYA